MTKSINSSNSQETSILDSSKCAFEPECDYLYGGCGINICFRDNNGYDSGVNPQDSLETQLSDLVGR